MGNGILNSEIRYFMGELDILLKIRYFMGMCAAIDSVTVLATAWVPDLQKKKFE